MRRTDIQRDSRPASHQLYQDLEEKAALEARNGLLQFDEALKLIDQASTGFTLRPSAIQRLQRLAIQDIHTCAGNYRTGPVMITGTTHQPPPDYEIAEHVEGMCDYINHNWGKSPLHLAWATGWLARTQFLNRLWRTGSLITRRWMQPMQPMQPIQPIQPEV